MWHQNQALPLPPPQNQQLSHPQPFSKPSREAQVWSPLQAQSKSLLPKFHNVLNHVPVLIAFHRINALEAHGERGRKPEPTRRFRLGGLLYDLEEIYLLVAVVARKAAVFVEVDTPEE
ncbi:unnamed protein product [Fraxinus pennsylvanica]|uniref:Uncharacterized protein n=1 Tax=Fraxinus pennsylvanica TaxID=56036 RepID=A0AAD1Z8I7_9LAMI|nr:unnamed protein product [Fraxinus pennsylvanica]